ncbi:histidine utilization repressor [Crenobacter cavernae]|uniref:Histidine utilization repressor n=1 Tax=Crenobacter cavernae TaxID=2290923 RepID=A0A345Y506_9NEIS|nr:histidine utilization repressor [Crenobacter cavernae]AXK39008.1 histidine utilization repressor [Crenobacter cavernae]
MTATPRYQQIKDSIVDGIRDGRFPPGSRIPSELDLAASFGVSRMTVNKAIRDLAEAGLVNRIAGSGTFVAEAKAVSPLLDINNIAEEIRARGHTHSAEVLAIGRVPASDAVAVPLGVRLGDAVGHTLIVHFENGVPIQLEDRYVNLAWAPDYLAQDFTRITPNQYLMEACPLTDIEHTVEAVLAGPAEQAALDIAAAEPCILVHRRTWSGPHLVSFARLWHPGSRYKLRSQTHVR